MTADDPWVRHQRYLSGVPALGLTHGGPPQGPRAHPNHTTPMATETGTPERVDTPPAVDPGAVLDAVLAALDQTGQAWLRRVVVSFEGGGVVLRGRVPSFYLKQMAQTAVLAIPGVAGLRNELQVQGER